MSDAYIVRRGGGGEGFDPNGAVLKVITSTGCTVLVTGTGYSKTHQQADGFPRSSDADATEHFFSIPASAFGTITVTATFGTEANTQTVTVDAAGIVFELYCPTGNTILSRTFGLKDGWDMTKLNGYGSVTYDQDNKAFIITGESYGGFFFLRHGDSYDIDFTHYSNIKLGYTASINEAYNQSFSLIRARKTSPVYDTQRIRNTTEEMTAVLTPPNMQYNPYNVMCSGQAGTIKITSIVLS